MLCTADGDVLGSLPPYAVGLPWWNEVGELVRTARTRYGVDVTILRLLQGQHEGIPAGGPVSYLAQVSSAVEVEGLLLWSGGPLGDEPLRQPYARPGGPEADVAWALAALRRLGIATTGPPEQVRTWNLSSLWRLPTIGGVAGAAWLKVVPSFFAHEGAVLRLMGSMRSDLVPPLLATEGSRVLLAEVPGADFYQAPPELLVPMVTMLVSLQVQCMDRSQELLALGAPDWRRGSFPQAAAAAVEQAAGRIGRATRAVLDSLVAGLDDRFDALADCGVPDTLVHGDFHTGNVRGTPERLVILDWGDCGVGNPLFDQTAFLERVAPSDRPRVAAEWARLWRVAVPGSDPERAAALLEPVCALRQAVIYTTFLANIEPSERIYHEDDPPIWLRRAADLVATEQHPR